MHTDEFTITANLNLGSQNRLRVTPDGPVFPGDAEMAKHLVQAGAEWLDQHGIITTIERVPLEPLAMGHSKMLIEFRLASRNSNEAAA